MPTDPTTPAPVPNAQATDSADLTRLFGDVDDLLPLWIAEPSVALAPEITTALEQRAAVGWYGYEIRPAELSTAFWRWMAHRHGWDGSDLAAAVSPSVGTSIGVLLDQHTAPGDRVILQPPVFTDFKPLVQVAGREVARNPLVLDDGRYRMDLDGLAEAAADPATTAMILCNPHNPVGRVWAGAELADVARICGENGVFVIADEIHADLVLSPHAFTPFARVALDDGPGWAALHGPIKTFGLAGVCDTLVITDRDEIYDGFQATSSRLHLTRNNVFGLAAFAAAYRTDGTWLDELLELVDRNLEVLRNGLPDRIDVIPLEGTYLAWLDLRALGLPVPELASWLAAEAGLALSPGHWFGREGAGFARMTVAAPTDEIAAAAQRLATAADRLG